MTFYNPNIQRNFDEDTSVADYLQLFITTPISISYSFCFDYKKLTNLSSTRFDTDDFTTELSLCNVTLPTDFECINPYFFNLFSDIVLKTYQFHLRTFGDYISLLKTNTSFSSNEYILYVNELIFGYIKSLNSIEFARNSSLSVNDSVFQKNSSIYSPINLPVHVSLYERLKVYSFLYNTLGFTVSNVRISPVSSLIYFDFNISL